MLNGVGEGERAAWKWVTCLSLSTVLSGAPSVDALVMHAGFSANRNKDSVPELNATRQTVQRGERKSSRELGRWCFYYAGSWSWRAVASAVRCVFTIEPKANRPTLRCSLTAWLMTSGTRCLWPSVPLTSFYTSTATGKTLEMNRNIRCDNKTWI